MRAFDTDAIVSWSRGAQDLYGWASAEVIGQVTHDLLQTQFPVSKDAIDAELRLTGSWSGELVHTRRDGQRVVVDSRQAVQYDENGQPSLTLEINSDITQRKASNASLRESEERFRLLVNSIQDYAIFLISPEGRVISWNEGAQRLKGYTPEEIIGESFTRFYAPEDLERDLPHLLLGIANEVGRVETEGWRVRKDGSRFWADVVITALHDDQGRLRGYAKITRDLTERKQAEDARARASREEGARVAAEAHQGELRASRDQLQAILSGVAEGIMAHDRAGHILYANDAAAVLCGFANAQEFQSASVPEIVSRFEIFDVDGRPVDRSMLPAQRVMRGERVAEIMLRFRTVGEREDGRWSVVRATPLRQGGGEITQVISIFRDVTEGKWAEEATRFVAAVNLELTRSLDYEKTLRRLADLAVPTLADWCVVDVLDERGALRRLAVSHVDPAKVRLAEELSARYPEDPNAISGVPNVVRTRRSELFADISDEQIAASARDSEQLAILRSLQIHSVMIVPLIAREQALGAITLVSAESGRRYGQRDLTLAEDVATRAGLAVDNAHLYREAQEQAAAHVELNAALRAAMNQLEISLKTRDEFLASAAHDLKNPLASIKGVAQLLQRRLARPEGLPHERLNEGLERINAVATRATELVEELLDVARLQMGRPLDLELRRMDLVALAREAVAEYENRSEHHRLEFETDGAALIGMWDERRLIRAVSNLLDNAVKYSPDGGLIRVRLIREPGSPPQACLSVEDEGVGIPAADLERVFQRFERGTNVIGEIAGTGIGLASARHIVESHGGSLTAASRPGRGATFTVRLPMLEAGEPNQ